MSVFIITQFANTSKELQKYLYLTEDIRIHKHNYYKIFPVHFWIISCRKIHHSIDNNQFAIFLLIFC